MRLLRLQDDQLTLTKFVEQPPSYAILSHTWGDVEEEVTFEDVGRNQAKSKKGYKKIEFCAKEAASHGLEFFWVDTCCINKTDVQEFQKAINSMYRWYRDAKVCFVYMADHVTERTNQIHQESTWEVRFRQSRWFKRSWTLQELLAPRLVKFYLDKDQLIGSKESLVQELEAITTIPASTFLGADSAPFSLEECILWAKDRESTYEEDQAYSLIGLCGVSMAPNYGEGAKEAFERLGKRYYKKLSKDSTTLANPAGWTDNWNNNSQSYEAHEVNDKLPLNHKTQRLTMKITGSGISIASLAEMFSTCLDILERVDSYKNFGVDFRAIMSQFDADKLLFKRWGRAVGLDRNRLNDKYHENLDDAATVAVIWNILASICDIAGGPDESSPSQQHESSVTGNKRKANNSPELRFERLRGGTSHGTKMVWTLRHKTRFLALSQQFGDLVGRLRNLVPLETLRSTDLTIGQIPRGNFASIHGSALFSRRQEKNLQLVDSQRILLEMERQIKRDMRKELDTWLCASFTNAAYSESIRKRLPGTCDWITERKIFCDWESADFAPGCAKLLWINGSAGYGKTILCASITEHLESKSFSILASFFFSADLEDRADPFIVARSWISQIISQNSEAFHLACERFDVHESPTASSSDIMDLLKDVVRTVPNCTLIVDGLDECFSKRALSSASSGGLESFLRITMEAISGTTSRILISSREDHGIRAGIFETATGHIGV